MLFPVTYRVNARRRIEIGGCDLADLAAEHGTPLYLYDEDTVRQRAAEFVSAMAGAGEVLYSAKAFASPAFLRMVAEEGMGLDVVSAGELHLAQAAGVSGDRIYFLGNNKSAEELSSPSRPAAPSSSTAATSSSCCSERSPPGRGRG
jgi:diaminopimelate decarboxylase